MQEALDWIRILWPLIALQLALFLWAIIDLIRRRKVNGLPRWAWTLVIIFVNIFGPIIYLAIGRGEE